ncbi:hypothetical protein BO94DRAFT_260644 [Aspergillus sclerotioniger CBS 115572]|uniref:Uncharacterized protein n=1 Tax=Aspergillus sclerotioniger CBS 115572 TaxID=1450535 RepID=A0A317VIC3_9EURO|nr:hypothetical protein BO94DRAFT_260644 [Aspergillus sclerotioniger CBS 115572]PWY71580.1 hypothetical protein BO94DRAFT_260644 [Aspergillus sclerotioniger CBS 115572]
MRLRSRSRSRSMLKGCEGEGEARLYFPCFIFPISYIFLMIMMIAMTTVVYFPYLSCSGSDFTSYFVRIFTS